MYFEFKSYQSSAQLLEMVERFRGNFYNEVNISVKPGSAQYCFIHLFLIFNYCFQFHNTFFAVSVESNLKLVVVVRPISQFMMKKSIYIHTVIGGFSSFIYA